MTVLEQRLMESAKEYFVKQNNKKIDWEQRRYEIARDLTAGRFCSPYHGFKDHHEVISHAVEWADILIEELKK